MSCPFGGWMNRIMNGLIKIKFRWLVASLMDCGIFPLYKFLCLLIECIFSRLKKRFIRRG